jgi:DNA-binding CsgD family transcriptional regulator
MGRLSQNKWSEAEDRKLVDLRSQGIRPAEIAKELGRSVEAVSQRLMGIGIRRSTKLLKRKYDGQ